LAVPDFQTLMRPLLALTEDGAQHQIADLREAVADEFDLSTEERAERIPNGRVTTLQNRIGWAATYLYRCGLLERPKRAHYRITKRGRQVLSDNPSRVDLNVLGQFEEFQEFRQRSRPVPSKGKAAGKIAAGDSETPEEQMEEAYGELRAALADDLLDRVREQSWQFFEDLVLDVLRAMGYGGPRGATERLGQSGDQGVDGVIREDALGLDLIYVQAKKWTNNVQRPDIQRFYGALHGQRATKGVFITTSDFSPQAREYAESVTPRVILVNGRELADLMIDHGVGVAVQHAYEGKRLDLDYFVDDAGEAPATPDREGGNGAVPEVDQ
jgi:restriction system protein